MSRDAALDNILLKNCARWAHAEYSLGYHHAYLERKTGVPRDHPEFQARMTDVFALDFNWSTNDGLVDWAATGRVTDMGHAEYAEDGSDMHAPAQSPFTTMEEVWAFDAVAEYGLPDFDDQVAAYEQQQQRARQGHPDRLTTGGYYRTIVSGAIATFGWEMLLLGASDPRRMEPVLDSFFRRTLFHMKAWAATSAEALITHDDFVWSQGPFMSPDFYRKAILPRYAELWKPVHAAGKKLLFCSDGDFTEFVDDLAEAGADGFIFEPMVDFGMMAERFGQSHCLVGSYVDCRDLTFRRWEKVARDIERTFDALERCGGAIVACGNHLPANIPAEMMDRYFDALLPRLARERA